MSGRAVRTRGWCICVMGVLAMLVVSGAPSAGQESPPETRRSDHVDRYHGVDVPDPYRWLEDLSSPEVGAWARAQDRYARDFAAGAPGRSRIAEAVRSATHVIRYTAPQKRRDLYFYTTFENTGGAAPPRSLHVREGAGGRPRTLLDRDELAARGQTLAFATPSPDGSLVAYGTVDAGGSAMTVRLLDPTGEGAPGEVLLGLLRSGSTVSWLADGSGFFYEAFRSEEGEDRRTARVEAETLRFHRVGTDQTEDVDVFAGPEGERWSLGHGVTGDGRLLVVVAKEPRRDGNRVYYADLEAETLEVRPLVPEHDATYVFVGGRGSEVWLRTDLDAPRGRIVAVDVRRRDRESWRELVPESEHTITSWPGVAVVGDRIVVGYLEHALLRVRLFNFEGRPGSEVELPYPGSVWSGFVSTHGDPIAFYVLTGLVDPGTVYRLDVESGESTPFLRPEGSHDPGDFVTEQVFYPAADGTRIPMFVVRRRDLPRTRPAPVIMYGYAFNWPAAPWYQPLMVAWLRMGGVWALPNTRGGAEYGETWHRAGMRRNKQTAIDDYVAAADWLVREGITTPDLMVANTSSAGGAVGGAAFVQRPDLFGAAILDYPVLDMLRYDQFTVAGAWRSEYGTSADPDDFRALLAYSPAHNVEAGTCYPATLAAPGELDEVTPPLHAYKFVAALQHAQACDDPVLLRVAWGAGHSAGATPERSVENWIDQLSFLVRVLEGWTPRPF